MSERCVALGGGSRPPYILLGTVSHMSLRGHVGVRHMGYRIGNRSHVVWPCDYQRLRAAVQHPQSEAQDKYDWPYVPLHVRRRVCFENCRELRTDEQVFRRSRQGNRGERQWMTKALSLSGLKKPNVPN